MAFTTNVPPVVWGANGFIIPSDQAILAGTMADVNAAFGGGLNPSLATPQGQLATSFAAAISQVYQMFLWFTTQTDPAFAKGRMQDAIARIYFIERNPAQPTVVQALCIGLAGVVIPIGALAADVSGNLYICSVGGTIPIGGQITLAFSCLTVGPIACPAGALNQISRAILGWDSINNEAAGVIGNNVETQQAFEARRAASVAQNSIGSLPSIRGAVLSVPNVIDAFVTENDTGAPVSIGGYTLGPNSLYVGVSGGTASAVAQAIWTHKAPGCAYNGNTTVTVYDTNSGYTEPYPAYSVTFETVADLAILFQVNLANNGQVPANAASLVQSAIVSAFGGGDGGPRAMIGTKLFASRFYSTLAALGPWVQIVSILVGSNNAPSATFVGSIAGNVLTVASVASGAIAIGQTISDTTGEIVPGTMIVSGSGSSWTLNNSMTAATEFMTSAIASLNDVSVEISQIPVVTPVEIQVALI